MSIDPYFADKISLLDGVTGWHMDDPEVVAKIGAFFAGDPWQQPAEVTISDDSVPGPAGAVPIRVYHPATESAPPLVWLHGGGFVAGDLDSPEAHMVAGELASRAGCTVYSVAYRLSGGDVRYPEPVDDVEAVWDWLTRVPHALGAPAIGGASAGAAIAVSTALRLRDGHAIGPRALLLAYPFVHFPTPATSFEIGDELALVPRLLRFTPTSIEDMVRAYVGRLTDLPREALPGAADLSGLPSTAVLISELDDLGPSGDLLVRQLEEIGVPVQKYIARGVPHGHLNWPPSVGEVERSLDFLAAAL